MSAPDTTTETAQPVGEPRNWWHRSHPTFAALTGFFSGMLFVTALPGAFAAILRAVFSTETAEELFPFVLFGLALPIFLLVKRKTRRFAVFMVIGMAITALVVLGVASLVVYFMVQYDAS
ncbi:hypothetical protein [Nocardioides sp.]|uniref:hypothetical protein n=1 Tax=Nocardioides sp. TaxID=35761 RepID=UPI00286E7DDD|nr:hypothetical protein [Nocardioides sp.]